MTVNHFRQYFDKRYSLVLANICSNNSDSRIWAFYSTYLTLDRDNTVIGLIHFVRKLLFLLKWTLFLAELGLIYKLFKAHVHYALT